MKFIADAQLPKTLSDFLNTKGFDSIHTLELPDKNSTTDKKIIKISNEQRRVIITKDDDFLESFIIKAEPRKLIMVKTGNISNKQLIEIFSRNLDMVITMISRSNLVEIGKINLAELE
jgi:predicted nuclease of predicted toxin-antitoxin system